ncbi:MAG: DUF1361 domain-containing protein [Gaiellaceae bacterium]
MDTLSRRRLAIVGSLTLLSGLAVAMVVARIAYTGSTMYANLLWNLVLAWVPFAIALAVYDAARRGARPAILVSSGVAWLLFFPNAPYLVTDFQLLRDASVAPVWYDVALLSAAAWAGLTLGFTSLYLMQSIARRVVGPIGVWLGVFGVLGLTSFGIYLGRVERWNSWDIVSRPRPLLGSVADRLVDPDPRTAGMTAVFTAFLGLAYCVFYSFARLGLTDRPSS